MRPSFSWQAEEFIHQEKGADWYWALGIIVVASAAGAFIVGNALFGILILIAGFTLAVFATRHPRMISFEINERGILVDRSLYPYQNLRSFWVSDGNGQEPLLLIESSRFFMPLISIPLADIPPEAVREFLQRKLDEVEHSPPIAQQILEYFGF